MEFMAHRPSPLGGIVMTADESGLTGLRFEDGTRFASPLSPELRENAAFPVFSLAAKWLDLYFAGHDPGFTPPLHMKTTPFRKAVWTALLSVPFGRTVTYGELASRLAGGRFRASPRAAGGAAGHNAILLIIPCHRVIGADGSLTGYAGGLERKARLLALEGAGPPPQIRF